MSYINSCYKLGKNLSLNIYILLFVLGAVFSCSKRTLVNTNEYNQMIGGYSYLNGSIKKITETPYKAIGDSLIEFSGEWSWDYKVITRFNKYGQINNKEFYDVKGLRMKHKFYYQSKKQNIPDSMINEYSRKYFFDALTYTFTPNKDSLTIKLYKDSILDFQSAHIYNKDFIPLLMVEGGENPNRTKYKTTISKDTVFLEMRREGELIYTQKFLLNDNNDWLWMKRQNFLSRVKNKFKIRSYSYVYDKRNNWVEKKIFDSEGNLLFIYKREIEYY